MPFVLRLTISMFAAAMTASAGNACIGPPPPIELPGESAKAHESRRAAVFSAIADEDRRRFQTTLFDKAVSVTLGLVLRSRPAETRDGVGREVEVRPVAALKGAEASGPIVLANRYLTSCGWAGGGSATASAVGEYVIVFEGNLFADSLAEPYGIHINEARDPRLLDALNNAAVSLRDSSSVKASRP